MLSNESIRYDAHRKGWTSSNGTTGMEKNKPITKDITAFSVDEEMASCHLRNTENIQNREYLLVDLQIEGSSHLFAQCELYAV